MQDYCERTGQRELLEQWDPEKNGDLTPGGVSYGSKQEVWWRCLEGHSWKVSVTSRTNNHTECPYCAGKRSIPGKTDLSTLFPDLAKEWDPVRNLPLTPEQVLPGSHKKAWWRCEKGHEWQAIIKSRVSGCGCPVCANRALEQGENDLATRYPELSRQWHPTKNGALRPEDVLAGTHRKVWWRCEKGHEWQAQVSARVNGNSGCPVCGGKVVIPGENDLLSRFPQIAAQWETERNGSLRPDQVSPYSNRRVWWRCDRGHVYRAAVSSRTMRGSDCPYCAGKKVLPGFNDLATREPAIAAQWHPTLNGTLTPAMVTVGSHQKVWWQCPQGHVWKTVIHIRTGPKRCGCPVCAGKVRQRNYQRYMTAEPETAHSLWGSQHIK